VYQILNGLREITPRI